MPRRKKKSIAGEPKQRGGKRKGAGRPKSETTVERERDVKAVVLAQPHRRGSASDWLTSPVGRLLDSGGYTPSGVSNKALYESANRFAEAYSKWQSVVSSPRPFANSAATGDVDIAADRAERYCRQWTDAWRAVRCAGEMQEKAVFAVVIDPQDEEWWPPVWIVYGCIEGLKVLADHFGIDYRGEDVEARRDAA